MATNNVSRLMSDAIGFQYNPSGIQRAILRTVRDVTNGEKDIVDPTNPFVLATECSAVLTSAFLNQAAVLTRKQYPYSAQTVEDLYPHMSDKDYRDRFAVPAKTTMSVLLNLDGLLKAMPGANSAGVKKLVLPRNSFFEVGGNRYSIQYPVEIRQMPHGGLQVVWDTSAVSPLKTLPTNIIPWDIRENEDGKWLVIELDVDQFNIVSSTPAISSGVEFKQDFTFTDEFYTARVYVQGNNGIWSELDTTHTEQIYDITKPTAVLRVSDNNLNVRIPKIYTNIMNQSKLRVDIYETKGPLSLDLKYIPMEGFTVNWYAIDENDKTPNVAAMYSLPVEHYRVFSNAIVSGGQPSLSFDELRNRVISNSVGNPTLPITPTQYKQTLSRAGYSVVKNIDNITNRVFLATKEMPIPTDVSLITQAAGCMQTLNVEFTQMEGYPGVITNRDNNGGFNGINGLVLTPNCVYQNKTGKMELLGSSDVNTLKTLSQEQLATAVTQGGYQHSPFHYVLDSSSGIFDLRPYYLDSPNVISRVFVAANDSVQMVASTSGVTVTKEPDSSVGGVNVGGDYVLYLEVTGDDSYDNLDDVYVGAQIAFTPPGETSRVYAMGTLVSSPTMDPSKETRIFEFRIKTNYFVTAKDQMPVSNFYMDTVDPQRYVMDLKENFDILYFTTLPASSLPSTFMRNQVDNALGDFLITSTTQSTSISGISHETLKVEFGLPLKNLWAKALSVPKPYQVATYTADVVATHTSDVYQVDPVTGTPAITTDPVTGDIDLVKIASIGDTVMVPQRDANGTIVLDGSGNPIMIPLVLHKAGDIIEGMFLGENGLPTTVRKVSRFVDIFTVDGTYWFANDSAATNYRETLVRSVVSWITKDLADIEKSLLEQTDIYFYPKSTVGMVDVMIGDGTQIKLNSQQSFVVTLHVPFTTYENIELKNEIKKTTVQVLNRMISKPIVTIAEITQELRQKYSTDVIGVRVEGLGGNLNLDTVTLMDDSRGFSLKKRLVNQSNNVLIVEEDATVVFINHTNLK